MVSVIIPCYNYGRFLAEALESIINQTYADWECIIVNDGSDDQTEEVAYIYVNKDKRFKYICQNNQGHSAARNKALQYAQGKYIQFLDADDLLESEKLKLQVDLLDRQSHIDLVYSDILLFNNTEVEKNLNPLNIFTKTHVSGKGEVILNNLIEDNIFLPGCVLMRKKIHETIGNLKTSYGYEDWEYFSRAALMKFYFHHDGRIGTRLLARDHGDNATRKHQKMLDSKIKVRIEIMQVINSYLAGNKSDLSLLPYLKSLNNRHYISLVNDSSTYEMYYGSLQKGFKFMLLDAWHSGKPFAAIKNGLYWRYLKLKGYKI